MTLTVLTTASNSLMTTLSKIQISSKIRSLDLEPIKFKLMKECGWTLEKADKIEPLYKGFLLINALHPQETHVPTQDIDDMWHAHILDTSKYMADCREILGYYLHHFPYLGLRGTDDKEKADVAFATTRERFLSLTGLDPLEINAADCGGGCGSSCGGGDSGGDSGGSSCSSGIISSCSSTSNDDRRKPARDPFNDSSHNRKKPERNRTPSQTPHKPLWQRILGLSSEVTDWERSVNPIHIRHAPRPGRSELLMLTEEVRSTETKH